jgi:Ser/Thr protein kinase RdoA (MazF antagonist)
MATMVPKRALAAYDLGKVRRITLVSSGLIHATYKVETEKGKFILQRLHSVLASDAIGADFKAVTEYLHEQGFLAPRCVLTKKKAVLAKIGKEVWRLQTFVPGKTYNKLERNSLAREAGAMYARFHKVMDTMPYRFKSEKILHETEKIYRAFKTVATKHKHHPLMREAKKEVDFVLNELPKLFLPKDLPKRVIHGDPKISNILFDAKGRAKTVVDLDTCNRKTVLVELGDAFRSWCGKLEDDPHNSFRLFVFRAGWEGYSSEADFLTAKERKLVPQAIGTITLELTARFLKDYFEDNYFGWDAKRYASRREHNLARARGQLALYRDLQRQKEKIKKVIA